MDSLQYDEKGLASVHLASSIRTGEADPLASVPSTEASVQHAAAAAPEPSIACRASGEVASSARFLEEAVFPDPAVAAAPGSATAAPCACKPAAAAPCPPAISRNQQKKIAKQHRKQERTQQLKEAKKQAKAQKREQKRSRQQEATPLTEEERAAKRAAIEDKSKQRIHRAKVITERLQQAETIAPKLVIDLDFWDLMKDGFQRSLVSQLAFSAGCNKRSEKPCSVHLTSFDGGVAHATARQFPGHANWAVKFHSAHWSTALSKQKESLVYLTADAEEEINSLDASCYYIIGGLVDRNQHKRICLNRAEEYGIRAARLPLSNFLQLTGSKVLTVNQVISILVHFWVTEDWKKACEFAVPGRKRSRQEGQQEEDAVE